VGAYGARVHLSVAWRVGLVAVAFVAGTLDAIGGGGGLLTLPALLAAGIPPHFAPGTNKGQSIWGTFSALVRYARAGMVDGRRARWMFPLGFAGSLLGARLVLLIQPAVLRPIVLGLLVAVAAFLAFRRTPAPREIVATRRQFIAVCVLAFLLGGYDGFFGPGTGTFLIVGFVSILGSSLAHASAEAKVVNGASNMAALATFATKGVVLWSVALPMAAAQIAAGTLGAHLAIKGGDRWIRRVVLLIVIAFVVKLAIDLRGS
jgi:uncharacterized membrane protein YfcA